MEKISIEAEARQIINRALKGTKKEDGRGEVKKQLPVPLKKGDEYTSKDQWKRWAERIAAMANAASGEPFIWVIGVDDIKKKLYNVKDFDTASWSARISSYFCDNEAPEMDDKIIEYDGYTLLALRFYPDSPPYVTKFKKSGYPEFIVPWRKGTGVKAANKGELKQILLPVKQLPKTVFFGCQIVGEGKIENMGAFHMRLLARFYIEPIDSNILSIPYNKCEVTFEFFGFSAELVPINIRSQRRTNGITSRDKLIMIKEPGVIELIAKAEPERTRELRNRQGDSNNNNGFLKISLNPIGFDVPITFDKEVVLEGESTDKGIFQLCWFNGEDFKKEIVGIIGEVGGVAGNFANYIDPKTIL